MVRKIETWANISVIVAALIFCATIVKDRWIDKPALPLTGYANTESRLLNTRLEVPGVQWNEADKTLVMALSTQCHFCQESTPFYKALSTSKAVTSKRVAMMMVFPQPQSEAESFVRSKGIQTSGIFSLPLQRMGVSSTPTIFLVDRSGKVEKLWVGVLSEAQQKDLLGELAKLS